MLLQSFSGHDAFVLQLEAVKTASSEYILFVGVVNYDVIGGQLYVRVVVLLHNHCLGCQLICGHGQEVCCYRVQQDPQGWCVSLQVPCDLQA